MAGKIMPGPPFLITNGQTVSAAVDLFETTLVGLYLPAAFTGVALTFQATWDPSQPYLVVKGSDGTSVSYIVAQGTYVVIQPAVLAGLRFMKLVSGSAEGADRTIIPMVRHCE